MNIASPPVFSAQDFPDTDQNLLNLLSYSFETIHDAVGPVPVPNTVADAPFDTPASGNADVQVKNPLGDAKPAHVSVTNVRRSDGAALTAAFAYTWRMTSQGLLVSFIGLPASTKCFFTAKVE